MAKKPPWAYYVREFINKRGHESTAAILFEVSKSERTLSISDCTRKIELSTDAYTVKDARNTVWKIEKLITRLQEFLAAYKMYLVQHKGYMEFEEK